jgi:hypothetical protein
VGPPCQAVINLRPPSSETAEPSAFPPLLIPINFLPNTTPDRSYLIPETPSVFPLSVPRPRRRQAAQISRRSRGRRRRFSTESGAVEHSRAPPLETFLSPLPLSLPLTCSPGAKLQNIGLAVVARCPEISGRRPLPNQNSIEQGNDAIVHPSSHRISSTISPSSEASGTASPLTSSAPLAGTLAAGENPSLPRSVTVGSRSKGPG